MMTEPDELQLKKEDLHAPGNFVAAGKGFPGHEAASQLM
jgi:hypothetical protein